ncbi:MAG: VWA domain-containing protein [Bradymonadaceae bacterium]
MRFAHPQYLYLLLLLLPIAGAWGWYVRWRRRARQRAGDGPLIDRMSADHSQRLRWIQTVLVLVAVALCCVAAARPQWGRAETTVEKTGVDVVFALDLSKSMLVRDVPPDRLRAATNEIGTLLDRLDGDRAGVVVFTSVSFVQSPLTTDYGAIRFYLNKLEPSRMSVGGTAIGRALRDSIELLTGEAVDGGPSSTGASFDRADTQVVVLVSDGEDHQSHPVEMARRAAEKDIRVVTVGIGRRKPSKIPVLSDDGDIKGYKRNDEGDLVKSSLKPKQLQKIARAAGGRYFEYRGPNSISTRLGSYLSRLEQSQLEDSLTKQYVDRFHWFLAPALLLLIVALGLGQRRDGRLGWASADDRDRPTTVGWLGSLLGLLMIVAGAGGCTSGKTGDDAQLRKGVRHLERGEPKKARKALQQADTDRFAVAYNRGLAELRTESYDAAARHFASALGARKPERRFDAQYNLGVALAKKGDWREAFDAFRQALRLAVDHRGRIGAEARRRARHNLEVAYFEFHPPCAELEEKAEENDTAGEATKLKKKTSRKGWTLCGLDADWVRLEVPPGSTVSARATFKRLREHPDPGDTFMPNPDELSLSIRSSKGETVLGRSRTGSDASDGPPARRTVEPVEVTGSGADRVAVWVRITGTDAHELAYDLSVQVDVPCAAKEDSLEENDARANAARLDNKRHKLQLCPGDADWFSIDARMGDDVFVDVRPRSRRGSSTSSADPSAIDVKLIDAKTGESVGDLTRTNGWITASLRGIERKRKLLVGVSGGEDTDSAYTLRPHRFAPCPAGDDRLEENDDLSARARLKRKPRTQRFLRLCPDDRDVYSVPPARARRRGRAPSPGGTPKKKGSKRPPTRIALSRHGRSPPDGESTVDMTVLAPDGSVRKRAEPPGDDAGRRASAHDLVATVETQKKTRIPVSVSGGPGYYHLTTLPPRRSKKKRRRRRSSSKKQSKGSKKKKRRGQSGSEKKRRARKKKRKTGKSGQKKAAAKRKKEKKSADEKRTRQLLRALQNDENFQMQKALEEKSKSSVGRDW